MCSCLIQLSPLLTFAFVRSLMEYPSLVLEIQCLISETLVNGVLSYSRFTVTAKLISAGQCYTDLYFTVH